MSKQPVRIGEEGHPVSSAAARGHIHEPARYFGPLGEVKFDATLGVSVVLFFLLIPVGGFLPGQVMDLPNQSPDALMWTMAGAGAGLFLALIAPMAWFLVRYRHFSDLEIREVAAGLARDGLFRRRAGRRRLKTLARLDRAAKEYRAGIDALRTSGAALADSTAPEPLLLQELDERADLLRARLQEVRQEAVTYAGQQRRQVLGGPEDVQRRHDQATLDKAVHALAQARDAARKPWRPV